MCVCAFVCLCECAQLVDEQPPVTVWAEVCAAASLFAWRDCGVVGAIGCRSAHAKCARSIAQKKINKKSRKITSNNYMCAGEYVRSDSHAHIRVTCVCVLYQTELSLGIWASSAARRGISVRSRLIRKYHRHRLEKTHTQKQTKKNTMWII